MPDRLGVLRITGTVVLISAAIWSKESAYAIAPIGVALLFASESKARKSARAFAVTGFGIEIVLFAHRMVLFDGPGGYINQVTGRPQVLSLNIVSTAKALCGRIWQALFLPINWETETSWLVGMSIIAFLCAVMMTVRGGRISVSFWLITAVMAAVLPAIHLALVGKNLLGSRILYLPSAVYCMWFGSQVRLDTRSARMLIYMVLLAQTIFLWHNLTAWRHAAALAESICGKPSAPRSDVSSIPTVYRGAYVFSNGYEQCLALKRLESSRSTRR